jgi:hypothetical protein
MDAEAWSLSGMADIRDDGGVYHADEADIHMKEVVVAGEDCSNDHSTDRPLDSMHAHEDNDAIEEVGGGAYGNLHTDRMDGRRVEDVEVVGLLHNNTRRTVDVVSVEDEKDAPATTIPSIHDFASSNHFLLLLLLLLLLMRLYSPTYHHYQDDLVRTEHAFPEQSVASHPICLICSWDLDHPHYCSSSYRYSAHRQLSPRS